MVTRLSAEKPRWTNREVLKRLPRSSDVPRDPQKASLNES